MAKITSITDRAATAHTQNAPERKELACEMIPGFHLVKVLRPVKRDGIKVKEPAGTWRFRYTSASGKVRIATIGRYPAIGRVQAAATAQKWRVGLPEVDPLEEVAKLKEEAKQTEQEKRIRELLTIGSYLENVYTAHFERRLHKGNSSLSLIRSGFQDWLETDIASLNKQTVHAWQVEKEKQGLRYSSIERYYSGLRSMVKHAFKNGYLDTDPLADVTLKESSSEDKQKSKANPLTSKRRPFTPEEIRLIREGLEKLPATVKSNADPVGWFKPMVILAMHTGLRPSDLRSLHWGHELNIQFKRLTKTPEKTINEKAPSEVNIPLAGEVLEVMRDWHQQCGKPTEGLVFQTPRGAPISKTVLNRTWNRLRDLTGLKPEFYATRHHFISVLVANNVPLLTVAKLAGHSSSKMIEKNYYHLMPDSISHALTVLSASLQTGDDKKEDAAAAEEA